LQLELSFDWGLFIQKISIIGACILLGGGV
jgi:hypothetical protein